ncbi:hypothetical protein EV2_041085 [Malus domestica]
MSCGYLSLITKNLIVAVVIAIFFCSLVSADVQCQGKCEDLPDCNAFCMRVGFKGGKCYPPLYQFCCCET